MDGDLEGGGVVEGVSPCGGGSKRPHLSPKGLTAVHGHDLAEGICSGVAWPYSRPVLHAFRRVHSCFAIRGRRAEVLGRVGIRRGAPLERPLTQRLARGVVLH